MINRRSFLTSTSALFATSDLMPRLLAAEPVKSAPGASATGQPKRVPRFGDGRDWWFEKRFGMFVHWGLYAIHGFHEQEQWRRRVPRAEYVKLAQQWNPVKFNPDAWLDLMQEAGMEYLCLTTKHHDGFCLWDTGQTAFNTMNTPYQRDVLGLLSETCHRRKVPLCLYYSIADWNQPNYPNQGRHHELPAQPGDSPDCDKYLAFLKAQVRELCTHYGEIHGFWWDMNVPQHKDPSINAMIRQLQPKAVINNRGFDEGDFGTPERDYQKDEARAFEQRVEANQSVGKQSWGYRQNEDYYTDRHLIASIDRYLARDANYLLNVGPKPDGTIAAESAGILRRIGKWYHAVKPALAEAEPCHGLTTNPEVFLTRRGNTVYAHLNQFPTAESVQLKPLVSLPTKATLLNDGRPVRCVLELLPVDHQQPDSFLCLKQLPVNENANTVLVVKLEFDGPPAVRGTKIPAAPNQINIR